MSIKAWIQNARELGASDLHIEAGTPIVLRVRGDLTPSGDPIPGAYLEQVAEHLFGAEAWEHFLERGSADASVAIAGLRCRVNLYRTVRGIALAVRLLTPAVNGLKACNLHPELRRLTEATSRYVGLECWFRASSPHRLRAVGAEMSIAEAVTEGDGEEFAEAFVGYDQAVATAIVSTLNRPAARG